MNSSIVSGSSGLRLVTYFCLRSGRSRFQSSSNICVRTARSSGIRVMSAIRKSDHADLCSASFLTFSTSVSIRLRAFAAKLSTDSMNSSFDLLRDRLGDAFLFVQPIQKPRLLGVNALGIDFLVRAAELADPVVVPGPALRIEHRDVVMTNRLLSAVGGSLREHVRTSGPRLRGARPDIRMPAEIAHDGARAGRRAFSFRIHSYVLARSKFLFFLLDIG